MNYEQPTLSQLLKISDRQKAWVFCEEDGSFDELVEIYRRDKKSPVHHNNESTPDLFLT